MRKSIVFLIVGMLIFSGFGAVAFSTNKKLDNTEEFKKISFSVSFSYPELNDVGDFVKVDIKEANTYLSYPGTPMLPCYSVVKSFSLGTKIVDVRCTTSEPLEIKLSKKVFVNSQPQWLTTGFLMKKSEVNLPLYKSEGSYPNAWYSYSTGGGIEKGEHVTFLSFHFNPVRCFSDGETLQYVDHMEVEVTYEEPPSLMVSSDEYSLIVIAPSVFSKYLQPLVSHKNECNLSTKLVTLNEIYSGEYFPIEGRDDAEKIKYFIKDAVEQWGTIYVLLVGSVDKLPIRKTWIGDEMSLITDLYYADLFFSDGSFCSWDSNNNGLYGEFSHNGCNDLVDLYPDVYVGRLPCRYVFDVKTVVDKIINYEKTASQGDWFNNLILCGGDTFPGWGVYEGEVTNNYVAESMSDFNHVKLWTSDDSFNRDTINNAINTGAGFLEYSGHGYQNGFGTYPPNGNERIEYFTRDLFGLSNGYRLPIMFFDACLTGEVDCTIGELLGLDFIRIPFPNFAWSVVRLRGGGAIASVGSTRVAYTNVDEDGPHAGAGYLALHFFKSYYKGVGLGEMLVGAKNDYLNNVYKDPFTVEEFILLGDPSLRVGGFYEK